MGDISSGMSSSIMQLYLKQVLEAFFHTQSTVRHFALNVIALTLNQGLIHPVQVHNTSETHTGYHWATLLRQIIPKLWPCKKKYMCDYNGEKHHCCQQFCNCW